MAETAVKREKNPHFVWEERAPLITDPALNDQQPDYRSGAGYLLGAGVYLAGLSFLRDGDRRDICDGFLQLVYFYVADLHPQAGAHDRSTGSSSLPVTVVELTALKYLNYPIYKAIVGVHPYTVITNAL